MQNKLQSLQLLLLIIMPVAIITGPFLSDTTLVLFSIIFFTNILITKKFEFFYNKYFIIYLIWCIYIFILSLFSSNILLSFESTLFYFRFGLFF